MEYTVPWNEWNITVELAANKSNLYRITGGWQPTVTDILRPSNVAQARYKKQSNVPGAVMTRLIIEN